MESYIFELEIKVAAINEDDTLSTMDIVVFTQGSYKTNTNDRYDHEHLDEGKGRSEARACTARECGHVLNPFWVIRMSGRQDTVRAFYHRHPGLGSWLAAADG